MQKHREQLAAIGAGGQAGQYGMVVRGKAFTADQIDALDDTEIEKMYARYEARLGAAMTKTLESAALQLYAVIVAMFLPIENQPGLNADLEGDPFVGHALSSATCELYHHYGIFLALLTAALTTLKHCQFGHCCPVRVHDGGDEAGEARDSGGASTESSSGKSYEVKDKKKVAAGCAGAAARKAKQEEQLLEQLRAAKESFCAPAPPANIPPKEADQVVSQPERREGLTNWTPWIVGACLTGRALVFLRNTQKRSPASVEAGPVDSAPKQPVDKPPQPDRQLKASPDPFYME